MSCPNSAFLTIADPDGSVGNRFTPGLVPAAIMAVNCRHDYSQIQVQVLAFVGYPGLPQDGIRDHHVTDPGVRTLREAVFGTYVGTTGNRTRRINRATRGAQVVELWGASHCVLLSNEEEVLRAMRAFRAVLQ